MENMDIKKQCASEDITSPSDLFIDNIILHN